jgi:hypothetical protein
MHTLLGKAVCTSAQSCRVGHNIPPSIAPRAVLCSSDLIHLSHSLLELFILAFLVAVSLLLRRPLVFYGTELFHE